MKRATLRKLIGVLLSTLFFFALSEMSLTTLDPLQIIIYHNDLRTYFNNLINDNGQIILPDGHYEFSRWTATIDNGVRVAETNEGSACHIAFIGDSVTFGLGVNDSDVWVNLLALQYPEVEIRNYGLPAYNVPDLRIRFNRVQADGYVHLIIDNDSLPGIQAPITKRGWRSSLSLYLYYMFFSKNKPLLGVTDEYRDYLAQLPDNTLLLGFEGDALAEYAAQYHGAIIIHPYTSRLSAFDEHPNSEGHEEIYEAAQPHVGRFISEICGE